MRVQPESPDPNYPTTSGESPAFPVGSHIIDEAKFQNWQYRWSSKQDVIDSLLDELERSMRISQRVSRNTLRVVQPRLED